MLISFSCYSLNLMCKWGQQSLEALKRIVKWLLFEGQQIHLCPDLPVLISLIWTGPFSLASEVVIHSRKRSKSRSLFSMARASFPVSDLQRGLFIFCESPCLGRIANSDSCHFFSSHLCVIICEEDKKWSLLIMNSCRCEGHLALKCWSSVQDLSVFAPCQWWLW